MGRLGKGYRTNVNEYENRFLDRLDDRNKENLPSESEVNRSWWNRLSIETKETLLSKLLGIEYKKLATTAWELLPDRIQLVLSELTDETKTSLIHKGDRHWNDGQHI